MKALVYVASTYIVSFRWAKKSQLGVLFLPEAGADTSFPARLLRDCCLDSSRPRLLQVFHVRCEQEALDNSVDRTTHREGKHIGARECYPYCCCGASGLRPTLVP